MYVVTDIIVAEAVLDMISVVVLLSRSAVELFILHAHTLLAMSNII